MLDNLVLHLVSVIDFVTILIIFFSFAHAVVAFVGYHTHKVFDWPKDSKKLTTIRIKLWEYLLLALEIFICADIILSVKDPTIEHLTQLWVVVVIRILIAHFLQKEVTDLQLIKDLKKEEKDDD